MKGLVSLSKKCKYNIENIHQIEKDVEKHVIDLIICDYGDKIDCQRDAETEDGFCLLHDPKAWSIKPNEVLSKFYDELKEGERFFIGIRLPTVELSKRKFERLEMPLCKFHQRADFSGAEFQRANFFRAKFQKADFSGAKFQKADFSGAEFQKADFSGAEFHQEAYFIRAEFQKASFSWAEFQVANFSRAKFQVANFFGAEFQEADFQGTLFKEAVNFSCAVLGVPYMEILPSHIANYDTLIDFYGAKFGMPSLAIFDFNNLSLTSFINVDISRVDFRNVFWFSKDGSYAIHDEEAFKILHKRIRKCPFKLMRLFSFILGIDKLMEQASCKLKNLTKYSEEQEKIKKERLMEYRWLIKEACKKTIKNKNAYDFKYVYLTLSIHNEFITAKKLDSKLANYVELKKRELISCFKEDGIFFIPIVELRSFAHLLFLGEGGLKIFIDHLNKLVGIIRDFNETSKRIKNQVEGLIEQASYYVQEVAFEEKENLLKSLKEIKEKLNDIKVVDEKPLEKNMVYEAVMKPLIFARRQFLFLNEKLKKEEYTLRNVLTVYRRLRENYDYNVDYETSGAFFIKEMELKRYASKLGIEEKSIWNYLFLTLYKWLANYGESYLRPILAMLITIIIFGLIDAILNGLNFKHIWHSLEDSVKTFFQMKELKDITMMQVAERAISPSLLGLLFLALRRKFERRFRH